MKPYEYQILRYIPDHVAGEFLNVGLVLFSPSKEEVYYEFINSRKRLTSTFHGIDASHIMKKIKILRGELEELEEKQEPELQLINIPSVDHYTKSVLKEDDSALQFSEVKKGMDISSESAFRDLKNRLLYNWVSDSDTDYRSDKDVWRERYRKHFQQAGLIDKLVSRHVQTKADTIKFDQAYKNGVWNYFQPINLNLKKRESIKNKVYRWKGIISEMQTADEEMKLYFLSEMPERENGISKFIRDQLNLEGENDVESELVTPGDTDRLLRKLQQN